ncbi:Histone-lysine N-methyltransferase [Bertholletia excelsa]
MLFVFQIKAYSSYVNCKALILTVCLLYELGKGKHSWWHPYLMQLPRSYDTLASFGQFETQALQVNDAIWATEKAIGKAESDWKEAIALMEELQLKCCLQTFEAWLWASATISSRTMHIPWDNAGCLCPVGDFFNYAAPGEEEFDSGDAFVSEDSSRSRSSMQEQSSCNGETRQQFDVEEGDSNLLRLTDGGYEESTSAYCFYARRNYKKGEQVLLSYGTYTNLELLEHYGFLLERNPNDKVFIPLVPEIYSSCSWSTDLLHLHQNGKPSFALLSSLRLWLTPLNQRRSVGHLVYSGSQLSVDNEIAVMGWIAKSCKVLLENFVTSVEEDKLLLNTIDKMQVISTLTQSKNVLSEEFKGEAYAFLENVGLINGEFSVKLLHCRKIKRCLDRWKIAVQWRLRYKRIVADCISYCTESISKLAQDCSFESL